MITNTLQLGCIYATVCNSVIIVAPVTTLVTTVTSVKIPSNLTVVTVIVTQLGWVSWCYIISGSMLHLSVVIAFFVITNCRATLIIMFIGYILEGNRLHSHTLRFVCLSGSTCSTLVSFFFKKCRFWSSRSLPLCLSRLVCLPVDRFRWASHRSRRLLLYFVHIKFSKGKLKDDIETIFCIASI